MICDECGVNVDPLSITVVNKYRHKHIQPNSKSVVRLCAKCADKYRPLIVEDINLKVAQ